MLSSTATAQENPPKIKIDENELTFNGLPGLGELNATLHIKEVGGEADIKEINIYSNDFVDARTGKRVTSDRIVFDKNGFNISRKGIASVKVSIAGNVSTGTYKGKIFVAPQNAEEQEISVTANINSPAIQIKIDESKFNLNGITGKDDLSAIMHIKDTGEDADILRFKVYSNDLVDEKTGLRITSDQVLFDKKDYNVSRRGVADVKFSIARNISAGSYSGKIFVLPEYGDEKEIPITVNVRDAAVFPLLVIFFGYLTSIVLTKSSNYIKELKREESLSESIKYLRSELKSHKEELGAKCIEINEKLDEADDLMELERFDDAENKIKEAREAFINFDFSTDQKKKIELDAKIIKIENYVDEFKDKIESDDTKNLQELLSKVKKLLNVGNLEDAETLLGEAEKKKKLIEKNILQNMGISPATPETKVETLGLSQEVLRDVSKKEEEINGVKIGWFKRLEKYLEKNLWMIRYTMEGAWYLLILLILSLIGIQVLYSGNSSFGADRLKDYIGAFLVGFGGDQAKEKILDLIKT